MAGEKLYIGSQLKTARLQKKIDIKSAVEDLRIPAKYLKAFEKNDLSQFPDNAYAIGFLKNYADYLGLEQDPLVRELKSHLRVEPLDARTCRPLDPPRDTSWVLKVAVFLLLAMIAAGAYLAWSYYKGNDYKLSSAGEMPAHLAAFLEDEGVASEDAAQ